MTFYEQMVPALSILLEIGETLKSTDFTAHYCKKKRKLHIWIFRIERKMRYWYPFFKAIRKIKGNQSYPFQQYPENEKCEKVCFRFNIYSKSI